MIQQSTVVRGAPAQATPQTSKATPEYFEFARTCPLSKHGTTGVGTIVSRRSYSATHTLFLNRVLFDKSECILSGDSLSCTILPSDIRASHIKEVLKVAPGDIIRAGILDQGLCDAAVVESCGPGPDQPVVVRVQQKALQSTAPRPKVSLICTLPRPRRFEQMLPVITNLGVHSIVVVGAADVPNDYFGSHLLRRPDLVKAGLVSGLAQAAVDFHLPAFAFRRNISKFLSSEVDAVFPRDVFHRVVAHPPSSGDDDVFGPATHSVRLIDLPPPQARGVDHIVVAVGGEGGWHRSELARMRDCGFLPVNLGPRVLRSDVAVGSILTIANDLVEKWAKVRSDML